MARIFFALNGKKINSLEELRENFNAKQMLAHYKSTHLHKWLEDQGFSDELENLNSFDAEMDDDTLLSMLMALFELSDEQIAKVEAQMPKPDPVKEETPAAAPEPVALPSPAPAVVSTGTASSDMPEVEWKKCVLPRKTVDGMITAATEASFELKCQEESPEDMISPEWLTIKQMFFRNGNFYALAATGAPGEMQLTKALKLKYQEKVLLKSSDGIDWQVIPFIKLSTAFADAKSGSGSVQEFFGLDDYRLIHDLGELSPAANVGRALGAMTAFSMFGATGNFKSAAGILEEGIRHVDEYMEYSGAEGWSKFQITDEPKQFLFQDTAFVKTFNGNFRSHEGGDWEKISLDYMSQILKAGSCYFSMVDGTKKDWLYYSRDGLKWEKYKETKHVKRGVSGNYTILMYNPGTWEYLLGTIR